MSTQPLLVVGLGNPGREYATTRHNVGWMALDELAARASAAPFKKKFSGEYATATWEGRQLFLLRPETYMNESGRSVQPAAAFFKTPPAAMLVLHDELDLPFGDVRLKVGGGHAGHNGLRSLIASLGTPDFVRLRIGIGRPPAGFRGEVADYVLSSFDAIERATLPDVVGKAVDVVRAVVRDGVDRTMNQANARPRNGAGEKADKRPKAEGAEDSRGAEKRAAREAAV